MQHLNDITAHFIQLPALDYCIMMLEQHGLNSLEKKGIRVIDFNPIDFLKINFYEEWRWLGIVQKDCIKAVLNNTEHLSLSYILGQT